MGTGHHAPLAENCKQIISVGGNGTTHPVKSGSWSPDIWLSRLRFTILCVLYHFYTSTVMSKVIKCKKHNIQNMWDAHTRVLQWLPYIWHVCDCFCNFSISSHLVLDKNAKPMFGVVSTDMLAVKKHKMFSLCNRFCLSVSMVKRGQLISYDWGLPF